jgi:hypothetical protein
MIKMLKELWNEYVSTQNEVAKMGIFHFPTMNGCWTYIDEEALKEYYNKKVTKDEDT